MPTLRVKHVIYGFDISKTSDWFKRLPGYLQDFFSCVLEFKEITNDVNADIDAAWVGQSLATLGGTEDDEEIKYILSTTEVSPETIENYKLAKQDLIGLMRAVVGGGLLSEQYDEDTAWDYLKEITLSINETEPRNSVVEIEIELLDAPVEQC